MKYSISNIAWTSENDAKVYKMMKELGYTGLEIAPTRIFPENPYEHIEDASKWANELKNEYGFEVASMQSIWYGRNEKIFGSVAGTDKYGIYLSRIEGDIQNENRCNWRNANGSGQS